MKKRILMMVCCATIGISTATVHAVPLMLDIDVTTRRDHDTLRPIQGDPDNIKLNSATITIKIHRSLGDVPEGKLFAELYVIGRLNDIEAYGIIDVKKGEIKLTEENDYTALFVSPPYDIDQDEEIVNKYGEYRSFLVVVSDAEGNVIDYRDGWSLRNKDITLIRKLGLKAKMDVSGRVIGEL